MLEKDISLGEFLRHERERRGITLEQVASSTKVGIRTLHALEGDQYSELPAKPFIRGFVTSYSRFIGLDPKDILTRYDAFISIKSKDRPLRDSGHSGYAFEKRDGEHQSRTVLLVAISGFIALGGIAMLVFKPGLHRSSHRSYLDQLRASHSREDRESRDPTLQAYSLSQTAGPQYSMGLMTTGGTTGAALLSLASVHGPSQALSPAAPAPEPSVNAVNSVNPLNPVKEDENEKEDQPASDDGPSSADPLDSGLALAPAEIKHKVVFKVLQDVWVRYQVDERPIRKFVIRKDKILVLRAKDVIHFQVSDPTAITFNYNGKGVTLLSEDPKIETRQETATLFLPHAPAKNNSEADSSDSFQGEKPLPPDVPAAPALSSPVSLMHSHDISVCILCDRCSNFK